MPAYAGVGGFEAQPAVASAVATAGIATAALIAFMVWSFQGWVVFTRHQIVDDGFAGGLR